MKNSVIIEYYYDILISILPFIIFDKQKNKTKHNIDTVKVFL